VKDGKIVAAAVLTAVADLAKWGSPAPKSRARGVAVVDCGIAINPDIVRAQVEGGIGYAVRLATRRPSAVRRTVQRLGDQRSALPGLGRVADWRTVGRFATAPGAHSLALPGAVTVGRDVHEPKADRPEHGSLILQAVQRQNQACD